MPIVINGSGTVTGLSVGGLPDGIVDTDMLAANAVTAAKSSGRKVLQVVSSHKVDAFATTSSSLVDITGMSRTITPTAASSKININISLHVGGATGAYVAFYVLRGSTIITQGTNGSGNMTNCAFGTLITDQDRTQSIAYNFLDSPSYSVGDTLTYKIQVNSAYQSREFCLNRTAAGANATYSINGTSTITLMEVAA